MTALVLPRRPAFWLPSFEPWRILRPLMNLNGNNIEYGDIGSPMGASMQAMEAGDDGDEGAAAYAGTLSYIGVGTSTADTTSYTFSSQPIGTASSDRDVIVAASTFDLAGSSSGVNSLTIGGVAASLEVNVGVSGAGGHSNLCLAILRVTSGTTADIVVSVPSSYKCAISVFTATGLNSSTAVQTATDSSSPFSQGITVGDTGGIIIGSAFVDNSATSTWTGLTEQNDGVVENANYSTAMASYTAAATPTVVWTPTSASRAPGLVVAYWR